MTFDIHVNYYDHYHIIQRLDNTKIGIINQDVWQWCKQNDITCIKLSEGYYDEQGEPVLYFKFEKEEDAMAFKLRWL